MHEYVSIAAALAEAAGRLGGVSDSPRLDAELLLCRAIDVGRSYLAAHPEDELDPAALKRYEAALERRKRGEPMAYITGVREFWSMDLMVTPDTLIPRPDTETLVEQALARIPRRAAWSVLDLGTGSGAIAIAIAKERPLCAVTATDVSAAALAVAEQNARQHDLDNVRFLLGDWDAPVRGETYALVVSNPPYVQSGDPALAALTFEPAMALEAGADGLAAIRRIATAAVALLEPEGVLLLEHGADQEDAVAGVLAAAGWRNVGCHRDLAGLPRVTAATRS